MLPQIYIIWIEPKGDRTLGIHDDALVITYLQKYEVPIGLTPKELDHVMHKVKWFTWEGHGPFPFANVEKWMSGCNVSLREICWSCEACSRGVRSFQGSLNYGLF